jgi:hypothetical protein
MTPFQRSWIHLRRLHDVALSSVTVSPPNPAPALPTSFRHFAALLRGGSAALTLSWRVPPPSRVPIRQRPCLPRCSPPLFSSQLPFPSSCGGCGTPATHFSNSCFAPMHWVWRHPSSAILALGPCLSFVIIPCCNVRCLKSHHFSPKLCPPSPFRAPCPLNAHLVWPGAFIMGGGAPFCASGK